MNDELSIDFFIRRSSLIVVVAGEGGFEPPNGDSKDRCLATWLLPSLRRLVSRSPLAK